MILTNLQDKLKSNSSQKQVYASKFLQRLKFCEKNYFLNQTFLKLTFKKISGETSFSAFSVPKNVTTEKLKLLLRAFHQAEKNAITKKNNEEEDDEDFMDVPYLFFLNGHEIKTTIEDCMNQMFQLINTEKTVPIVYQPQAIFRFEFHVLNFYELKKKNSEKLIAIIFKKII